MKDRRKTKRRYLLYYMRVYDAVTRVQIGNLVDITPRGIMIVGDSPIPTGKTSRLRVELSDDVAEKPFMEFSVLSKWNQPDIGHQQFNTGFEILDLTEEDATIIRHIIDHYGFRDNKPTK